MNSPGNLQQSFGLKARRVALLLVCGWFVGCEDSKPSPAPAVKPIVPLSVLRSEVPTRVFSAEEEIPSISYAFKGAKGNVRVTMEIEGISGSAAPVLRSLNDVLFKAEGEGRISVGFKRPWPDHPNGRVTVGCLSGSEESSSIFEPELWFHHPSAIITLESAQAEPSSPVVEGKEVVLARYVARNIPRDLRLTFKAVFTKEPLAPRMKAGLKPPP